MDESDPRGTGFFESRRPHLRAVAYRLLGDAAQAEDAVQEAWLRLERTDVTGVTNLAGWLTTVTARIALTMLRARRGTPLEDAPERPSPEAGPADLAERADAVGAALLVVLDTLAPAERLAFVLHDLFGVPFDEIATIVERSPEATRQLASRARRRVRGVDPTTEPDLARRRTVVEAFLAAAREGDFGGLLTVLDPDVVLRADETAVASARANRGRGAPELAPTVTGADAVARAFAGRASAARAALLDGVPGAVYAAGGEVRSAFRITVLDDRIVAVEVVADPRVLATLVVV